MCPPNGDGGSLAELAIGSPAELSATAAAVPVLIVDDDPVVRSLMRDALEDEGFAVDEAEDGVEALMACAADVPALFVVDAVMPRMDGFALCRELRRRPATAHLPILMATGLDDHASIAKAYEAGATDFIAKWRAADLTERAAAQSHFRDLCDLLGEPTPTDADPKGE